MESLPTSSTTLDSSPGPLELPACSHEMTILEYQCYTETSDCTAFRSPRSLRSRLRPPRKHLADLKVDLKHHGRREHREKGEVLRAASKLMIRKNHSWLGSEDLMDVRKDKYRAPLVRTIPDTAPITILTPTITEALNEASASVAPSAESFLPSTASSTSIAPEDAFSSSQLSSASSADTVKPTTDNVLSSGMSVEEVCVCREQHEQSHCPSAAFTMCRGDSVDGLFIPCPQLPPDDPPELATSPLSLSSQSPFRRQLFASFITRQSALVSRINKQSCRLLETVAAVAANELAQSHAGSEHVGDFEALPVQTSTRKEENEEEEDEHRHFVEAHTTKSGRGAWKRTSERLVSMCDSGVWVDADDDLCSLSRGSSYTLSEDSEGNEEEKVLCGNRVSQMTKTYNDIDAVTRLLQEKEKDLELAAKIGQQLLGRNKALEERNALLDAEVSAATEKITQLKHDLQMKTDLLQIYTNDVDDTSSCDTTPTSVRHITVDILQHRVRNLEDENKSLRQEACQLADDTLECEDKEKELVSDVIKQLSEANLHVGQLSDELAKKVEDSLRQQEEITQLLAQVVDLQSRNKRLVAENEELANMVGVARECQQELTMELAELKEKYAEVLDLLHDTQDQLRRVQKKNLPGSRGHHLGSNLFSSPFNSGNDSIASELHSLSSTGEEGAKGTSGIMRRTFDTVRLTGKYSGGSQGSLNSLGYGGSIHSTPTHHAQPPSHMATPTHMVSSGGSYAMSYMGSHGSSVYSGGSGHPSLDSGADSDASMHTDSEDNYPGSHLGVPGWPGTPDLNACLRRLGPGDHSGTPSQYLPYGCRTPDSIMSTGSGKSGLSGYGSSSQADWRLPQKLQIVKPIEGSLTLHQWSRLATPHLGGLLEEREGVAVKGGTSTGLNLEVYSMSDFEEDDVEEEHPGKRFMSTSGVFTYTNSTVLHPDDLTSLTPSVRQAQVSVLPTAAATHTTTTPCTPSRAPSVPPSRRGSTATFSVNTGLAKVLNERGMSHQSVFSPTATPANSPSGSRPGSPEPEGYKLPGLEDLTKTFYYGASLLRRTFYKGDPSAPQSPTGPRVNLVEQVQAIGVDRFVGLSGNSLTVGGVVTSRPATSPLLHLSNLIMSSAKTTTTTSQLSTATTTLSSATAGSSIMCAPKVLSPGERRPSFPSGAPMGIPGHPGSGHLDSRLSQLKPGQRTDLGTVGGRPRPTSLGKVPSRAAGGEQNVGTVGWTSFGRKGGLL